MGRLSLGTRQSCLGSEEMSWQAKVGFNSHEIPQQYLTPNRVNVPMEEQEARANRFVSLVVGHTDRGKQPKPSKQLRLWQLADLRVNHLEGLLHRALLHREACSDLLSDRTSQTQQG